MKKPICGPNSGDPRFEIAKSSAGATIAGYLVIKIPSRADVKLLRNNRRKRPIQMGVGAALILRVGIDEIVGQAEHDRPLNSRLLVKIGVANTSVDCPMTKPKS